MLEFGAVESRWPSGIDRFVMLFLDDRLVTTLFDMLLRLLDDRLVTALFDMLLRLLGARLVMTLFDMLLLLGVRFVTARLEMLLPDDRFVMALLELILLELRLDEMPRKGWPGPLLERLAELDLETDLDEEAGLEACRL